MRTTTHVEPVEVAEAVELFITREHADATKYDNRSLLDQSGAYNLHSLAAEIYASGFAEGMQVMGRREQSQRQPDRDRSEAQ